MHSLPFFVCVGPVHVHNPGTVIFSLLSQFTGQVGPTIEGGKTVERQSSEEEDERNCPVFHPTSSPSIHLSEEERSGEIDSIFFPSQEQGKDCHVSKEEALWCIVKTDLLLVVMTAGVQTDPKDILLKEGTEKLWNHRWLWSRFIFLWQTVNHSVLQKHFYLQVLGKLAHQKL